MSRYSIDTGRSEDFFTTARGGRVLWEHGPATCERCGCEIDTGKRNDEPAEELRTRLKGKRSKVSSGVLSCAGCGKPHAVRPENEL